MAVNLEGDDGRRKGQAGDKIAVALHWVVEVELFHANDKRDKKEEPFDRDRETDTSLKFQTEVIRENGFSPMFMSSQFKFKLIFPCQLRKSRITVALQRLPSGTSCFT